MMTDGAGGVKPSLPRPRAGLRQGLIDVVLATCVVAAARSSALVAVLPALGVFAGPLGWALLALAVVLLGARALGEWRSVPAPSTKAVFVAGAAAYALLGLYYASRLQASGDEPHYLLMAQSLWRDGDLDLRDNLARGDWKEYTPGPVVPHYGAPRADGRPYPGHGPGLPFLLAPVYALGGRAACMLMLAVAAAAAAALVHSWARRLGHGSDDALLAWAIAAGPPLLFYSFHVYTEAPATLALWGALWLLARGNHVPSAALAALGACALPFLHNRMLPAALVIALLAVRRLRGGALAAFGAVALLGAAAFFAHYHAVYGRATPMALYQHLPGELVASPLGALAGLLFDRSFGLLPHAPVYVVGLAGLFSARRLGFRETGPLFLAAAAVLSPVLVWRMWWGGQSPPGRLLLPALPALALAAAARGVEGRTGLFRWRWPLAGLGLALALFAASEPTELRLLNRAGRPDRLWAALDGVTAVDRYLPSLTLPLGAAEDRVALLWAGALAALLALDRAARRSSRVDALFRTLAFPLGLALSMGALIDGWARAG